MLPLLAAGVLMLSGLVHTQPPTPLTYLSIFYTIGGSATNGNDYAATGSVVTIPAIKPA